MSASVLRVGLTGNIAAGKSTVAAWLADLGCVVLDLDRLGHECLRAGSPTHRRVATAFGEHPRRRATERRTSFMAPAAASAAS